MIFDPKNKKAITAALDAADRHEVRATAFMGVLNATRAGLLPTSVRAAARQAIVDVVAQDSALTLGQKGVLA